MIRLLLSIFPVVEIRTVQQLHVTEGRISMSKIQKAFEVKKAFIPFITCGDPNLETTEQLVYAMERAGASLIELGIPIFRSDSRRSGDPGSKSESTFRWCYDRQEFLTWLLKISKKYSNSTGIYDICKCSLFIWNRAVH